MSPRFATRIAPLLATLVLCAAPPAQAKAADGGATIVEAAAALAPGRFVWEANAGVEPVTILISIADQRLYVYRGQAMVAASTVSTGREGNETPVGVFTILQKKALHKSNLYDDAPMPYMQRLTWDGVAIHAGKNPGYPASHGCIRVPASFAKKLFEATAMGATVEVTDLPVIDDTPAPVSDYAATAMANQQAAKELNQFLASR